MTQLTKFVSEAPSTAGVTTTQVNPELAGSGYGEQARMDQTVQQGLVQQNATTQAGINSMLEGLDRRDELTFMQGRLDMQAKAYQLRQQFQTDPRSPQDKIPDYQGQYNQLTQTYANSISNPFTRGRMQAEGEMLGSRMVGHMQAVGLRDQQAAYVNQMKSRVGKYTTMLYDDPTSLDAVKQQFQQYSAKAQTNGIDPIKLAGFNDHMSQQLDQAAYSGMAVKDPHGLLDLANKGAFDEKGFAYKNKMTNMAQSTLNAWQGGSKQELKTMGQQLMNQGPIPDNYDDVMNRALNNGLQKDVQTLDRAKTLKTQIAGLPLDQQVGSFNKWLNQEQASPTLEPDQMNFVRKTMSGQIQLAQKDPLDYAVKVGGLKDIGAPAQDPSSPEGQDFLTKRLHAVETAKSMLGIPVSPYTHDEIKQLSTTLPTMPIDQQMKVFGTLSHFDEDDANKAITTLGKHNPVFGAAASLQRENPELAQQVLAGHVALKSQAVPAIPEVVRSTAAQNVFQGMYADQPDVLKQIMPAADAKYAHDYMTQGNSASYEDALRKVSGASPVFGHWLSGIPGYSTLLPQGVSADQFEGMLKHNMTPDNFSKYGNGTAARFADGTPATNDQMLQFQAYPSGYGQYIFKKGNQTLLSDDMQTPFTMNLKAMSSDINGTPGIGTISGSTASGPTTHAAPPAAPTDQPDIIAGAAAGN